MDVVKPMLDKAHVDSSAISKDGYAFNPADNHWRLNKDVVISLVLPHELEADTGSGFRRALRRYAEESSARHTENMATRFKRYMRDTGAKSVTVTDLINWRAMLGESDQWHLGGLKGFLLAWHEYEFDGISENVADLLKGWRIKGNEKGRAVSGGDPESGPYTDLEMAALLDWANMAVSQRTIAYEDYAYLLTLAMTARRPVQIAALRGKDLVRDERDALNYRLNIPRAKQRGGGFRREFRSLAIIEDLYLVLSYQYQRSVRLAEEKIGGDLPDGVRSEIPVFPNASALDGVKDKDQIVALLFGKTPDALHATTSSLKDALWRCAIASRARSERTGEFIHLSAMRFRHTRGTKLRREGFGPYVIAELLDHSDIQNVKVYTENTAQEAVVIDQLVGAQLAPFAQACLGRLVFSEREAIRGDDPRSRKANDHLHGVGTCGNYGFCVSGYRACYTCRHFQPWVHGPHEEVLADLYAEKTRMREAGCAEVVVNANDQLIIAVEHCVLLCKAALAPQAQVAVLGGRAHD